MSQEFHDHLDECAQCRHHPMALCRTGVALLYRQAFGGPDGTGHGTYHHGTPPDLRRVVSQHEIDEQRRGSTRIAPGIWRDKDGDLHYSIPELLAMVDLDDTPANREQVVRTCTAQLRALGLTIIRQDPEA
jgi:hypothetical protein